MIAIDLSKQEAFDVDPKAIQQTNFTENLRWEASVFFIAKAKETISGYSPQGTVRFWWIYVVLI